MAPLATLATMDPAPVSSEGKLWAMGSGGFWATNWNTLPASSMAWEAAAVVAAPPAVALLGADLIMCPRRTRAPRGAATPRPAPPAAAPPPPTPPLLLTIPTQSQ